MTFRALTDAALGVCMRTFGEDVTYTPQGGAPVTVAGVFRDEWVEIDPETRAKISTQVPNLGIRLSDFAVKPKQRDTLVRSGTTYAVNDVREDGEGSATLFLYET
jgi:hypothetical protein